MLSLRPYKPQDAKKIVTWLKDETSFFKWSGSLLGDFPLKADFMNEVYFNKNGLCEEADNFYPWVAFDGDEVIGHFIMRYTDGDKKNLRFGWVVVDDSKRGKGYGREMLQLGLKYAFEIMKVEQVTIGVYDNNPSAVKCYRSLGFVDNPEKEPRIVKVKDEEWKCLELVIKREGRIPFEISVHKSERPNRRTIRAMKEGDALIAAEDAPSYHSLDELRESLEK